MIFVTALKEGLVGPVLANEFKQYTFKQNEQQPIKESQLGYYEARKSDFTIFNASIVAAQVDPVTGNLYALLNPDGSAAFYKPESVYKINNYPIISTFSNISDWALTASTPGTVNISQVDEGLIGKSSLRFQSAIASGINAMVDQDRKFNLNAAGGFWVCWENKYYVQGTTQGLTMYLSHSAGFASGVGRVQLPGKLNTQAFGKSAEWISNSDWTTLDGTPNFSNDWLSWRFLISSATQDSRDYVIDGVVVPSKKTKAKVLLTLDDSAATGYTIGHVEARKRGIKLTHYAIAQFLGSTNYQTLAQVQEMHAAGDTIAVHGAEQWTDISKLENDLAALNALGSIVNTEHGAWVAGVFGTGYGVADVIAAAKARGLKTIRKTSASGHGVFLPGYQELGALPAKPLSNNTSLVQAKSWIDQAIASGGALIFYGHKFGAAADATTWVTADWIELLDYIAQKAADGLIDAVTIDELYKSSL